MAKRNLKETDDLRNVSINEFRQIFSGDPYIIKRIFDVIDEKCNVDSHALELFKKTIIYKRITKWLFFAIAM